MKKGYKGELQKLVESRKYFKALLNEQAASCWLTYADSTVGGTAYASGLDFSPGGTHFQMYCAWWFFVGTGTGYGTYPLVPNLQQWYWNPNNTNPPGPLSSILQEPTGT
jgi:hypothetical protein